MLTFISEINLVGHLITYLVKLHDFYRGSNINQSSEIFYFWQLLGIWVIRPRDTYIKENCERKSIHYNIVIRMKNLIKKT